MPTRQKKKMKKNILLFTILSSFILLQLVSCNKDRLVAIDTDIEQAAVQDSNNVIIDSLGNKYVSNDPGKFDDFLNDLRPKLGEATEDTAGLKSIPDSTKKDSLKAKYCRYYVLQTANGKQPGYPRIRRFLEINSLKDMLLWRISTMAEGYLYSSGPVFYMSIGDKTTLFKYGTVGDPFLLEYKVSEVPDYDALIESVTFPNDELEWEVSQKTYNLKSIECDTSGKVKASVIKNKTLQMNYRFFGWKFQGKMLDTSRLTKVFTNVKIKESGILSYLVFPKTNSVVLLGNDPIKVPLGLEGYQVSFAKTSGNLLYREIKKIRISPNFEVKIKMEPIAENKFLKELDNLFTN
jgi:hypothetical protein